MVPQPSSAAVSNLASEASASSLLLADSEASFLQTKLAEAQKDPLDVFPILSAQKDVQKLLEDEETFRTMVTIGLPTGSLQMPPNILFNLFKRLENQTRDPGEFMDAAIEYIEYARDANDLIALARLSRTNGGGPAAVQDYLDRAMIAAKGAGKALNTMVPLLPGAK